MPNVKNVIESHVTFMTWNSTEQTIATINDVKTIEAIEMIVTILANNAFLALKAVKNKIENTNAKSLMGMDQMMHHQFCLQLELSQMLQLLRRCQLLITPLVLKHFS